MPQLSADVFAFGGELMPVETAAALIAARVAPVPEIERVALLSCDGRVLAHPLTAPIDLPPFANSAVDGYAVRHADLAGEGSTDGVGTNLPVVGRVAAGHDAAPLRPGHAMRVFTGAPMPAGADTVFMQEDVAILDDGRVALPRGLKRGANMRPAGEDLAKHALALSAGTRLSPHHVALAAALGCTDLPVRRKLQVGVFSTGDELVEPGHELRPATLYDSNRPALQAMLRRAACDTHDLGILPDSRAATDEALGAAAGRFDLVVSSGGVSTGAEDHVRAALEDAGALVFWRLAIKPGRPVAMGLLGGTPFIGLPGNPVAVFVTFAFVVRPLLAALLGEVARPPVALPVRSGFDYRKKAGRREYVRVSLRRDAAGVLELEKYPVDGAGVLTSLTRTDGLAEIADAVTSVRAGDPVGFLPYNTLL